MRKLLQRQFLVKVLLAVLMLTGMNSWGQDAIYSTNFGSGTLPAGWSSTNTTNGWAGNSSSASSGYAGASGSGNVVFNSTGGNNTVYRLTYSNTLSTVGFSNITVLWGGRGTSSFTPDIVFEWSTDGSTWNAVTYTYTKNGNTWALVNGGNRIALPAGAAGAANLRFRFSAATANNGNYRIDDFSVQGTSSNPTVTTTAGSYGPFCANTANNITVNYTTGGGGSFAGTFQVQHSNAGGTFPSNTTTNLMTTVSTGTNAITATLPSGLTAGNYRVRVVNTDPATASSNDNNSNIVLTASVAQNVTVIAAQNVTASSALIRSTLQTVGVCPVTIEKGFVIAKLADNADPLVNGIGVSKIVVTATGIVTGDYNYAISDLTGETAYRYKGYLYDGTTYTYTNNSNFTTTGTVPSLSPAVGATLDTPFTITFPDNAAWRTGISAITVNGTTLAAAAYNKDVAGQLTITPGTITPLRSPGTKTILITSTNYPQATVSQDVAVGAPNKLAITSQPTAPATNGAVLANQPVVVVRDQYDNLTASTAQITAVATASTWTLGGTATINAVNGTAAYTGLTASTSATSLASATIQFTSTGLTSITSNAFAIPPANDLCANAVGLTLNAAAVSGTMVGSSYTPITGVSGTRKDVWYSFVAGCNGTHIVTASGFSGDIDMTVFSGSCPTSNSGAVSSTNGNPEVLTASNLVQGTTYYIRVFASNTTAESSTFTIQVVNSVPPAVTAGAASNVTPQAATIAGTATVSGCSTAITAYGVEYSQSSTFVNGTGIQVPGSNLSSGSFSVALAALTPGTTYYYRTYATNTSGTTYSTGAIGSFTTSTIPVSLPYIQNFEETTNEWLLGAASTNKWIIGNATQNGGNKSLYISNNNAAYAYATSSVADIYAEISVDLTNVTSATLSFDWKSNGEVSVGGTIYDYGEVFINNGTSDVRISTQQEFVGTTAFQTKEINLTPYVGGIRKLRFRWVNDNTDGTGVPMAIDNISITEGLKPTVTTTAINTVVYNSANGQGNVTDAGSAPVTARGIVYSTVANPTVITGSVAAGGTGTGTFTANLTGLQDNKLYYARAFATNAVGTAYGSELQFTTASIIAPALASATNITTNGVTLNWNAVSGAQNYGLDVSTSPTFGSIVLIPNLIISEYVEGSSNNRSIEIYNGTGAAVNLSSYSLRRQVNGAGNFTDEVTLSGTLADGEVYVVSNSAASSAILAVTDRQVSGNFPSFTGNDVVALYQSGNQIDMVGVLNSAANWGTDVTLVRKPSVSAPTTTYNANDWTPYPMDYIADLGTHTYGGINPDYLPNYQNHTVNGTSHTLTGLQQNTTYYYRVRANGVNSSSVNSLRGDVKTGAENIWDGTAWTPGPAPTAVDIAIIQGDYNTQTNGTFTAGSMRVDSGVFTIASGTNLTVQNELVIDNELNAEGQIEGGQFNIENNANLIQVNDVNNSGLISVTKNSARVFRLDYAMWSSPVSGETLKGFSPNTLDNRFYIYNPVSNAYNPVAGTTEFAEGRGYLIRLDNTHAAYDAATNYQGTPWTGTYIGTPNNGTTTVPLTAGYNSVGNPYPSPINIAAFYAANTGNLGGDAALYFWRKKNGGDYSSYASLTLEGYNANGQVTPEHPEINYGDAGMGEFSNASQSNTWVLNPGQGFIVQSNGNGIVFNNQMRVPVNNGQIFSVPGEEQIASRMWLNLTDATGTYSQTMLSYSANGTPGIDYGRDGKAFTDGSSAFYSIVGDTNLGIQARPVFDASDVVPMGYKATAGTYTVSLHRMEGVFAQDQDIFLKDNLLGTTHNLKTSAYQFTTEAGTFNERFDVIYAQPLGNETPSFDANNVIAYKNGNAISISTGNVTITGVTVYDTRGRLLYNASGINATETSVNGLQAQQQVLIVKIATEKGEVSKKIIF